MRKVLFISLAIMIVLTSSGFAAKLAGSGDGGKLGIGMYGATPTLRYNFTEGFSGQLGLGYQSCSTAGLAGQFSLLAAGDWDLYKIGANTVKVGFLGTYTGNLSFVNGWTSTTIALTYGVETMLNQQLSVGLEILPISFTSQTTVGTATYIGILNTATLTAHIYL